MPRYDDHALGFTIVATPHEYKVDYTLYEIVGGKEGTPLWPQKGALSGLECVRDLAASEPYLHGEVKWDGCSNWHFDEQERVQLHGCCRADLTRLGEVLGKCWDLTKELCLHWDG